MNSMTGFGRGVVSRDGTICTIEIKTVNARFCDIIVRCPRQINAVEDVLRKQIQSALHRGKVEVMVTLQDRGNKAKQFTINRELKEQIKSMLIEEGFLQEGDIIPLQAIMSISNEWIQFQDDTLGDDILASIVDEGCAEALHNLSIMRSQEGTHIKEDLKKRTDTLYEIVNRIDYGKDMAVTNYHDYLMTKMKGYLEELGVDVSIERFLQEVALLADKTDITEEIVRFRSHVVQLKNTLTDVTPIGRKLDFLIQEMNREVNTMGSKASDMGITEDVVKLKCELEKIREQIQNIE